MICPLCGSKVVFEGMFSLECDASKNPLCENKSKHPPKLPESECEWNTIFAEFGNPWGLFFSWGEKSNIHPTLHNLCVTMGDQTFEARSPRPLQLDPRRAYEGAVFNFRVMGWIK